MHLTTFLLPLAVSGAVLKERQAATGGTPHEKVEELKPQFRKEARRTLTKFGPFTITGNTAVKGGGGMGDSTLGGVPYFLNIRDGLCNTIGKGPCTMIAGRVGVVWADGREGTPANGIYIHHILSSDKTKKETPWISNCGNPKAQAANVAALTGGAGFLGTGEDGSAEMAMYNSAKATEVNGYHIGEKDTFSAWAQLVNYNKEPAKVYVFYDMEWVPGFQGDNVKTVTLSATCGGGMIKMSQSGPTNTTSGKFYIMEDGRLLGGRGHLHDGGVAMDLLINDKYACSSDATYGDKSVDMGMGHSHGTGEKAPSDSTVKTISYMTDCNGPFPVKKGDYITLRARYDLAKHPLRKSASGAEAGGVMGMMGMIFAQGQGKKAA